MSNNPAADALRSFAEARATGEHHTPNPPGGIVMRINELADELKMKPEKIIALANRSRDPFPLRNFEGKTRYSFALPHEVSAWLARNTSYLAILNANAAKHGKR